MDTSSDDGLAIGQQPRETQPASRDLSHLVGSPTSEELELLLDQGAALLESKLTSDSEAAQVLLDLLGRHIAPPGDANTWPRIRESITYYFGEDLATLLFWIVYDSQRRLEWFLEHAGPAAKQVMRKAFGLYGPELARALQDYNENPNDWTQLTQDVWFSQMDSEYLFRSQLRKMNDEVMLIETRASGYLFLVTLLCRALRRVDSATAYEPQRLEQFREELKLLDAFFGAEAATLPTSEATSDPSSSPT